ncbi:MAG: sensor histidine kinase [Pelomonas sp.]|nr:sensor histidine kinase [Roseateles sp.]
MRWRPSRTAPRPGAPSLRRQLLLWLVLPQIVLWLAAASFTYELASYYANAAIDATLSQASHALARQIKPLDSGLLIDFPRAAQDILESDPKDRVLYTVSTPPGSFILGNRNLPDLPAGAPIKLGEPYFYDGDLADGAGAVRGRGVRARVRVAALLLRYGASGSESQTILVQVARSSANREELARRILLETTLPLSALIGLMTMIVWAGIRAGLAPLAALQRQVAGRAANDLSPISLDAAPPEVRSLAQALNSLLAEVDRSVAAQKRFINDAAHQLRTPLAGLKSQVELALADAAAPAQRERLQQVLSGAARSAHLVHQLLSLARAEPEAMRRVAHAAVDLEALARDVTAEMVPRALGHGVDLGFDGRPDAAPPTVSGIALLLREALVNLVDNAIRYAGRDATVTVRVRREGAHAVVEVEDNGPGIAPAEREHVFERFVRATHDGLGCGLGLAIVRDIVERHGGRVELRPVDPSGVLARVELPLAEQT